MNIVQVELRKIRERLPVITGTVDVKVGDRVLLSTDDGLENGMVMETENTQKNFSKKDILMRLVRVLNEEDKKVLKKNELFSQKMTPSVKNEIKKENLNMHLSGISYTYDRQKLFIYYTAPERVDYRYLIKSLGSKLKTRIQMVCVGPRDETSITGGIGLCGREVCCRLFLWNKGGINMDMVKNQHLSLNTESISGCCGRLMCCLKYENDFYCKKKNSCRLTVKERFKKWMK